MNETVTKTLYYYRPVARESLPSSIKQEHLTATGYVVHQRTSIFCHAHNIRNQYQSSTSEISAMKNILVLQWDCYGTVHEHFCQQKLLQVLKKSDIT